MGKSDSLHNLEPVTKMCKSGEGKSLREFMGRIGDKWSILIVAVLVRFPGNRARFSELQRIINGISHRMLTTTLRQLERDGFVTREVFAEVPPRVEYELTTLGLGLMEPMLNLVNWIGDNWLTIKQARNAYDTGQRKPLSSR